MSGMDASQSVKCKIVVIGDSQCGKTALLHVFAKDCFPEVMIFCMIILSVENVLDRCFSEVGATEKVVPVVLARVHSQKQERANLSFSKSNVRDN